MKFLIDYFDTCNVFFVRGKCAYFNVFYSGYHRTEHCGVLGAWAGYAYYGEYPLSFAACFGYEHIYDYLIDHGADPNRQDSFGNNVLHMMVIVNQTVRIAACRYD